MGWFFGLVVFLGLCGFCLFVCLFFPKAQNVIKYLGYLSVLGKSL